jgi:hypothetical protein
VRRDLYMCLVCVLLMPIKWITKYLDQSV